MSKKKLVAKSKRLKDVRMGFQPNVIYPFTVGCIKYSGVVLSIREAKIFARFVKECLGGK